MYPDPIRYVKQWPLGCYYGFRAIVLHILGGLGRVQDPIQVPFKRTTRVWRDLRA